VKELKVPTYSFLNNETNEIFDSFMSFSSREDYLKQNPHIQSVVTSASIVSGVSITGKIPDGFKEVLSKVAESHKSSTVADNHGKKSSKEIKTKQLVDKHIS
jgi:hypothetical protein